MNDKIRLRFAPSPTGALHIGGVRTALYNYLFAKKEGGTLILRIEDTDQKRYVAGAEDYILESLRWLGIEFDEGPGIGGEYGPYRQSERKDLYGKYAQELVDKGHAYYAFDSEEELTAVRTAFESRKETFRYDGVTRENLKNSLTLDAAEVKERLDSGAAYTIRLKVPRDEEVKIDDIVRGEVVFSSNELDDKVMLKGDGMPTYHLANIVDDHLMKISHVVRGEEWLPSTAHHILLYRFFGWEETMPQFAHLPLILRPNGKGKLSKRDGNKLGIPVFPISWEAEKAEDSFKGFREFGFMPQAVLNFLAFLGWNPGTEQEMFSLKELGEAFTLDRIGKAGARFDFVKAEWFNQQYLMQTDNDLLGKLLQPLVSKAGYTTTDSYLTAVAGLMKERVNTLPEILETGYYFFEPIREYEEKMIRKKWKPEREEGLLQLNEKLENLPSYTTEALEAATKAFLEAKGLGFGDVFPFYRIALSGTTKGPGLFEMMEVIGKEEVKKRLAVAFPKFNKVYEAKINA